MSQEQTLREVDSLIENAKWEMYAEEWTQAGHNLQEAKKRAIQLRDKARIDVILDLQRKAGSHDKVPVP